MGSESGVRTARGVIVSRAQQLIEVEFEDGVTRWCASRRNLQPPEGELESGGRSAGRPKGRAVSPAVVGDRVEAFIVDESAQPVVEKILARRNSLRRRAAGARGARGGEQILIANVDLLCIAAATSNPPTRPGLIDRALVLAEDAEIPAIVVFTKCDAVGESRAEVEGLAAMYRALGYEVMETSAVTGAGVELMRMRMAGLTTAIIGPSGAGKSTLLNAISPGLGQAVGEISEATGKGMHTTTAAKLMSVVIGGKASRLADTPGVREMGLHAMPALRIAWCMPELRLRLSDCRFGGGCTHTHEVGCAVKAAVESGAIAASRYRSYCRMLTDEED